MPLAVAVGLIGLLFARYAFGRAFVGDQTVCFVTAESLSLAINDYGGGDHPLDPSVDDMYVGNSGCNTFETQCVRKIEFLGSRLDC